MGAGGAQLPVDCGGGAHNRIARGASAPLQDGLEKPGGRRFQPGVGKDQAALTKLRPEEFAKRAVRLLFANGQVIALLARLFAERQEDAKHGVAKAALDTRSGQVGQADGISKDGAIHQPAAAETAAVMQRGRKSDCECAGSHGASTKSQSSARSAMPARPAGKRLIIMSRCLDSSRDSRK